MKNFCEATVIRPNLSLDLHLICDPVDKVTAKILLNDEVLHDAEVNTRLEWHRSISLLERVCAEVTVNRKHPGALCISLTIDGLEILPLYQFHACPPTCYLDTNSIWRFEIDNVYTWYHNVSGQGWII
jgi:hypothetical protein